MANLSASHNKNAYIEFCNILKPDIQVFAQPWYLNASCGETNWDAIVVEKNGGGIVAAFPYYIERKKAISIRNPQLTPRIGIWIDSKSCTDLYRRYSLEEEATKAVIEALPQFDVFNVAFDSRFSNWQGFFEYGFTAIPYYSYVYYHDEANGQALLNTFHGNQRRCVVKAIELGVTIKEISIDDFWIFQEKSFLLRDRVNSIQSDLYHRIASALCDHKACRVTAAIDKEGKILCTLFIFFDDRRCYEVLTSYNPTEKPDCRPLLTYDAMQFAFSSNRDYDFEGSMIPGVSRYDAAFNGHKEPYLVISKYGEKYLHKKQIKDGMKALRSLFR